MKNKLIGSFYPYCNSKKTFYLKNQVYDGIFYIQNRHLVFQKMFLQMFKTKVRVEIPLNEIERVENIELNGFLPYGVLVVLKNGKEYMFGHAKNRTLQEYIQNAKAGMIMESSDKDIKNSTRKKKIIGIIVTLLISFIVLISVLMAKDFKQEDIIKDEIQIINNLDITEEEINMSLKTTDEDYQKVELAVKEYYRDFFSNSRLYYTNSAVAIFNTFTTTYLKENKDKLDSMNLFKMLNDKTNELNKALDNIVTLLNEDEIMKYIEKYDLHDYYIDFYRENMISKNDKIYQENWLSFKEENTIKIKYLERIIELLIDYNHTWYIEDDNLYISDDNVLNEYNSLYDKIYDEEESNEELENTV